MRQTAIGMPRRTGANIGSWRLPSYTSAETVGPVNRLTLLGTSSLERSRSP